MHTITIKSFDLGTSAIDVYLFSKTYLNPFSNFKYMYAKQWVTK